MRKKVLRALSADGGSSSSSSFPSVSCCSSSWWCCWAFQNSYGWGVFRKSCCWVCNWCCCSLLLLGVDLFATIITQHSVLLPTSQERAYCDTLRSSLRPHETLIPGPNPHHGPKARRNIEVTNSRFWGIWSSETQVSIQVSKSWFWEFSPVLFGRVVELLFRSGSRVIQPGSLIQVPKSWFFRVII